MFLIIDSIGFKQFLESLKYIILIFSSTSSRPIWVSGYNCVGDETTLESCSKENPVGYAPFCTHNTDAGLMCGMLYIAL